MAASSSTSSTNQPQKRRIIVLEDSDVDEPETKVPRTDSPVSVPFYHGIKYLDENDPIIIDPIVHADVHKWLYKNVEIIPNTSSTSMPLYALCLNNDNEFLIVNILTETLRSRSHTPSELSLLGPRLLNQINDRSFSSACAYWHQRVNCVATHDFYYDEFRARFFTLYKRFKVKAVWLFYLPRHDLLPSCSHPMDYILPCYEGPIDDLINDVYPVANDEPPSPSLFVRPPTPEEDPFDVPSH